MSTLHMIRIPINLANLARWSDDRGWAIRRGHDGRQRAAAFDEGRALHHLLDEICGPGRLRPFRLMVPPRGAQGNIYAYGEMDRGALLETIRACAMPDHLSVLAPERIESKVMPETWRKGQRLGFDLRIRPVRRLRADLPKNDGTSFARGAELDAFLVEALRQFPTDTNNEESMRQAGRTRLAVYLDWLNERLGEAASLETKTVTLTRFVRNRIARGTHAPEGPDATLHGVFAIRDPAAFSRLLAGGVGRHKAYGYGMVLLRPPSHAPMEERPLSC